MSLQQRKEKVEMLEISAQNQEKVRVWRTFAGKRGQR